MNKIFEQLLGERGLKRADLKPRYEELISPWELPDMDKGVRRIIEAIERREKILIYGDYDVDGITASAVMYETLKLIGGEVAEVMLPDRFVDGYGMSKKVVQKARKAGVKLVITVDCGSSNGEIVQELKEVGVDTIITDHHEILFGLPDAIAVVNPKRTDRLVNPELKGLCGAEVAFEMARALMKKKKITQGQEKWLMDLVILGMVADSVKMTGENWKIGYFGMIVLKKTRRLGLKNLFRVAGITEVNTSNVGFRIAPRLNAAGRMETAELAFKLLVTKNVTEAAMGAEKLEQLNKERKEAQNQAVREIEAGEEAVIVARGCFHEGVIGIVAGRLMEQYRRPAFVFTEVGEGCLKCSGRSFGEFNLGETLKECEDLLVKGGGHAAACGATIAGQDFEEFKRRVNGFYEKLKLENQERFFEIEPDVWVEDLGELTEKLVEDLRLLEPFGEGNESPIFGLRKVNVRTVRKMGQEQNHVMMEVEKGEKTLKVKAFFAPEAWLEIKTGEVIDMLIEIGVNEWNGTRSVEGMIKEIR